MFFIKEEQLCGYLPPLALFLYPVLRHYLRSNAGAAEVSEAQFLMVGAHCSPVTPEWPCLCRAGSIILARTIVWESVCSGSTLWSYNFSNYFIFKPGLSLFFCFNWVFFPRGIILWWLWAALCRQHPCLGLVDVHLDLHVETSEKNELL